MPTTNPVPSQDPSDLLFNAGKLDEVVSGSNATYTDRLGISRRTMAGIDSAADVVLGGLGYAPPVAYASGIALTLTTQTVEYSGEVYAPKVSVLPFTTSGTFETAKFRLIQGVASADLPALVGQDLQDYAALRAYTGSAKRIYITGQLVTAKPDGVAGVFQHDPTDTTSLDNGGTIIVDASGRRWKRQFSEKVEVKWFGAKGDWDGTTGTDDTATIQAAINFSKSKYELVFQPTSYRCDGGLILSRGSILSGISSGMPDWRSLTGNLTRISFTSTAAGFKAIDFDQTDVEYDYIWDVSIKNIHVQGVTAIGSIGINAWHLANARFKNVGISRFNRGLNVIYGMTNTFDSVSAQLCTEAALYIENSYGVTTTQRFVDCAFRQSGWGAILAVTNGNYILDTVFDHCLFESTLNGGINVHKGCSVSFIDPYFENVTNLLDAGNGADPAGAAIRLYFDGNSTRSDTLSICNIYSGDIAGPNIGGPFQNALVDVGPGSASVNIYGTLMQRGLHGVRVDAAVKDGVVNADQIAPIQVTNVYTGSNSQRRGLWPDTVLGAGATIRKNYSSYFGSSLRTDANTIEIRNSNNTGYYTLHSASQGDAQSVSAVGPASTSTSYVIKTQASGVLKEASRLNALQYFKATSNDGSYAVPNTFAGSADAGHAVIANAATAAFTASNLSTNAASSCIQTTKPDIVNGSHIVARRTDSSPSVVFSVAANGNVTNTNNSYGAISDIKLKQDIADATSQWSDIKALTVRKYKLKEDPTGPMHIGLIAQEAELVSPGLIEETADMVPVEFESVDEEGNITKRIEYQDAGTKTKSIKYSIVNLKMLKALQEALMRIETLEAEVLALKS